MNLLKPLENAIKDKIVRLEIKDFTILSFLLGLAIAGCSFLFGYINLDPNHGDTNTIERYKIFFQVSSAILLLIFPWVIYNYVQGNIDKKKKEYDDKIQNLKQEYKQNMLNYQKGIDDIYRKNQELDFLSIFWEENHKKLPLFDYQYFCKYVQDKQLRLKLEEDLEDYLEESKWRKEALEGLRKGFVENTEGQSLFSQIVGTACNHALNIQDYQQHKGVKPLYLDIFGYLKAWLVCSIKYAVAIPIKPYFQDSLEGEANSQYRHKETYIKAIKFIKDEALNDKITEKYFPTKKSLKIVSDYLGKLIVLIEDDCH